MKIDGIEHPTRYDPDFFFPMNPNASLYTYSDIHDIDFMLMNLKAKQPVERKQIGTSYPGGSFLDGEIFEWINKARTDPKSMIPILEERPMTPALMDAIKFLSEVKPVKALQYVQEITFAARDHVMDIGPVGGSGKISTNGDTQSKRLAKYGKWSLWGNKLAEQLHFGKASAKDTVINWLIDDKNSAHPNRQLIFNSNLS